MATLGFLLAAAALLGQTTASVRGTVRDASGAAMEGARVELKNAAAGLEQVVWSAADGSFQLANLPLNDYALVVSKPGFETHQETISLRSNIPQMLEVVLEVARQAVRVDVSGSETSTLVDVQATGTRMEINSAAMGRMPVNPATRGIESVLLSLPGFAANANGAIHPRGAHNQMTYVVDGMPVSDQLTGAFANAIDPSIVQSIELLTGNIPVEYGAKVSGVAVITTRSGLGAGRWFSGNTQIFGGQFDTAGQVTQATGGNERLGYFASVNTLKSNRFLDQVSRENLHNGGNAQRAFLRLDYQASARNQLRVNLMGGRSSFQVANLRSQHAAGQDQRQRLADFAASVGWLRTLNGTTTLDVTASYRTSIAQLLGSPGDTPVTAHQARHLSTVMGGARWTAQRGRHLVKVGGDWQHFPVSEAFSFGITNPAFNDPESEDYVETLAAHDLTRGGRLFEFHGRRSGALWSAYIQDTWRVGRWTFSPGLRWDAYRFLAQGNQLQPRIGLAFHVRETGTVLRLSYNRTYQTPPNENLLLSSSVEAARLVAPAVREALGSAVVIIRPERQNVFEAGVQQALGSRVSINAAAYHKNSRDVQDNDNFLNTGIIFPTSLQQSRTNGAEARVVMNPLRRLSGSVSLTHYHTVVTPPFTGGLFLGSTAMDLLSAGPFVIDHDQKLGVHALGQYSSRRGWWVSAAVRYDSGLVSNPSDPDQVAADPDYADLLPYVNLAARPPRVRPRTIVDAAGGYERVRRERRVWELMVQVTNLTNRTALYNFQSIFVGTRLVQPRSATVRLRIYF